MFRCFPVFRLNYSWWYCNCQSETLNYNFRIEVGRLGCFSTSSSQDLLSVLGTFWQVLGGEWATRQWKSCVEKFQEFKICLPCWSWKLEDLDLLCHSAMEKWPNDEIWMLIFIHAKTASLNWLFLSNLLIFKLPI